MNTIRVSEGTAAVLGLKPLRAAAAPTTAYLMLGGECLRGCSFCAQGRSATGAAGRLSRVTWPEYSLVAVLPPLVAACTAGTIKRICVQTVAAQGALASLEALLGAVRAAGAGVPVSASVYVRDHERLGRLFALGLDHAGLAIDVASPAAYSEIKGGDLRAACEFLLDAALRYPGRVSTHLIFGLGETERELLELLGSFVKHGITVGLFAFTPVRGTPLAERKPPDLAGYRRVQAGAELLRRGLLALDQMGFDDAGRLSELRIAPARLREYLADGAAFETSGCPDCNRPYYNERPGQVPYNYPWPLNPAELEQALTAVLPLAQEPQP